MAKGAEESRAERRSEGPLRTGVKQVYPLKQSRRHIETGPIVLVSFAWKGKTNVMTMGWHLVGAPLIKEC
jgi:hypothetical protein